MGHLVVPESVWDDVMKHFDGASRERFGFLTAGVFPGREGPRFAAHEFIAIDDQDVNSSYAARESIDLDVVLRVLNKARAEGRTIVEIHNHPTADRDVRFSSVDEHGLDEFGPYAADSLGVDAYGALVLGRNSIDGVYCTADGDYGALHRVVIAGRSLEVVRTTGAGADTPPSPGERYARQIDVLGQSGQDMLAELTIAICGVGGLGSHVLQQLLYLGIRRFILIDDDVVDETNLNRLVGAGLDDLGRPKVDVGRDLAERVVESGVDVRTFEEPVTGHEASIALLGADIVFGCFDNDGARLQLNHLCRASNLVLFDLASGISVDDGKVVEAGGRLVIAHPDGPCMFCLDEIDRREAQYFLASTDDQRRSRERGYVDGWDLPSPSVVSLNGAVASLAINEFMKYVSGCAEPSFWLYYYMIESGTSVPRLASRFAEKRPGCYTCDLRGRHREYCPEVPREVTHA